MIEIHIRRQGNGDWQWIAAGPHVERWGLDYASKWSAIRGARRAAKRFGWRRVTIR